MRLSRTSLPALLGLALLANVGCCPGMPAGACAQGALAAMGGGALQLAAAGSLSPCSGGTCPSPGLGGGCAGGTCPLPGGSSSRIPPGFSPSAPGSTVPETGLAKADTSTKVP